MPILAAPDVSTLTTVTLVSDSGSFSLQPADNVALQSIDLGFPVVRAVANDRTDGDGSHDLTARHGARAVALNVVLIGSDRLRLLDDLRSLCHPSARPYLVLDSPLWDQQRRMRLRVSQQAAPMPVEQGAAVAVQLQWVAPDGVLEAVAESQVTVPAAGGTTSGVSAPLSAPVTMPAGSFAGMVTAANAGSTFADPVVLMYGPCSGPVLSCDGQGALSFPSLTIAAGDYVAVDFKNRSVLYNGVADASRLRTLTFSTASWWRLAPGSNTVRYVPSSYSGAAAAVVTWRSSWL